MRSVIYTAMIFFAGWLIASDDLVERFERASAKRSSPGVEQSFVALNSDDPSQLKQKLTYLSKSGFSNILLTSIPPETHSWQEIVNIADHCGRLSMKLGCTFFVPSSFEEGNNALLSQLGWFHHDYSENQITNCVPRRSGVQPLASVLVPIATNAEQSVAGNLVLGYDALPQQGQWHEFEFSFEPVQPHIINYFNQDLFTKAANQFLLTAQQHLDLQYGTVLDWIWFCSLPNSALVWSEGLEFWFNQQLSLDLIRHLPALARGDVTNEAYVQSIQRRYQQGIKKFWREKIAENVGALIQSAGLNAGIRIDEIPLDPEEVGGFFAVTLMNVGTNKYSRTINRRAAGGTRVFEGKNLIGRIDLCGSRNLKSTVDTMIVDGAESILFDESILDFSGDTEFVEINNLTDYLRRIQFVVQNSKLESHFLLCSSSIPERLNQYSFDNVNLMMLEQAEVIDGYLSFVSGRRYTTVVFSDEVLRSVQGKKIALALKTKGVRVLGLALDKGDQVESHRKLLEGLNINELGEMQSLPELMPCLAWYSDQSQLDIRFIHRSGANREFYLIKNESELAGMVTLTFTGPEFNGVTRWQPMDGKVYEINQFTRIDKLHTSIPTLVRPGEMFFIVFDKQP